MELLRTRTVGGVTKSGCLQRSKEGYWTHLSGRYKNVVLADVDGDHDLDAILSTESALHVREHKSDHSFSLPTRKQAATFPVSHIRLSGHTLLASDMPKEGIVESIVAQPPEEWYGDYRPYLADWDLDGDLDMAILSDSPMFHTYVRPRFFEHTMPMTV